MSNNDEHSFLLLERQVDGEPRPDPDLSLSEFNGTEEISVPFTFELGAFSSNRNIGYEDYIGQNVTVSILLANNERRHFNGIISRFAQVSGGEEGEAVHNMAYYTATMVPWLWLLTRYANSRIFQNKTVQQIVDEILTNWDLSDHADYAWDLSGSYEARTYCVQYRETDFNFISRVLEEEGIFYFFRHEQGRHALVLADDPGKHPDCPHQNTALCQVGGYFDLEEPDVITNLEKMQEIRFGNCTLRDFNFESPNAPIQVSTPSKYSLGPGQRELYDYPGLYSTTKIGQQFADIRMQEEEARITTITGSSLCRAFLAGTKVKVVDPHDYYRDDLADREGKDYVLVSVSHMASQRVGPSGSTAGEGATYANSFTCIPFDVPYRPPRITPKPVVQGTQTAKVVGRGQGDEEIYTDGPCQVKVKFHWDRSDQEGDTSCWIRVAQPTAGAKWGGMVIPRIGQEVIVDFLEGDPDRPIIIGCVYNAANPPAFEGGIVSGMKSNTSPGGGGYNEISMNDTKGKEGLTMHGQYDMNTTVEHDQTNTVNNKFTETIKNDATIKITEGNYSHDVVAGKADYHVQSALTEKYDGTQETTVKGNLTIKSTTGAIAVSADAAHVKIDAATKITLHTGASTIEMDAGGNIKIDGVNITINGSGSVTTKGTMVTSEASAQHQIKGAIVKSDGSATNTVKGGTVLLNP